ncbi:MAG: hypothetical protein FWC62_03820 [Firmicutes bacterium]|nr:hypothetical protein [Bacillota bacterium]
MDKRVTKTILAIVLIVVGIAVTVIFNWNVFALNLPDWAKILSIIVGIPLMVWGLSLLVLTYRKQK